VEEQFYLLWPLLFCRISGDLRRTARILAVIIVAIWIYRAALVVWLPNFQYWADRAFDARADNLAVGCLLAVLVSTGLYKDALVTRWWFPIATIVAITALFWGSASLGLGYLYTLGYSLGAPLIAILLMQLIVWGSHPAWRWLNSRPVRYVGRISYGMYLYHYLFASWAVHRQWTFPVQFGFCLAGTVAVASASYYLVELPFLRMKRRWEPDERGSNGLPKVAVAVVAS
jgi:peptidoglycan/LPS O-acetylase OafA/YrhL